jgi:hypothetical protein
MRARKDASQALGDGAFGPLQIALFDSTSKTQSAWLTLPGTFVRAPHVVSITCSGDPGKICSLFGTGLEWIASIDGPAGTAIPPGHDCTPQKELACISVPWLAHYVLHLRRRRNDAERARLCRRTARRSCPGSAGRDGSSLTGGRMRSGNPCAMRTAAPTSMNKNTPKCLRPDVSVVTNRLTTPGDALIRVLAFCRVK